MELSYSEDPMIVAWVILTQCQRVTDRQTDLLQIASTALCIVSYIMLTRCRRRWRRKRGLRPKPPRFMTDHRQFNGLNQLNVAYWQRNRDELKRCRRNTISLLLSVLTHSLLSTTSIISVSCTTSCRLQLGLPSVQFLTGQSNFLAICPVKNMMLNWTINHEGSAPFCLIPFRLIPL